MKSVRLFFWLLCIFAGSINGADCADETIQFLENSKTPLYTQEISRSQLEQMIVAIRHAEVNYQCIDEVKETMATRRNEQSACWSYENSLKYFIGLTSNLFSVSTGCSMGLAIAGIWLANDVVVHIGSSGAMGLLAAVYLALSHGLGNRKIERIVDDPNDVNHFVRSLGPKTLDEHPEMSIEKNDEGSMFTLRIYNQALYDALKAITSQSLRIN